MKFEVYRTSTYRDVQPCDGAVAIPCTGNLAKFHDQLWIVEVDSLESLLKIANHARRGVIIHEAWGEEHPLPQLEIYDDYRE